LLDGRLLDGRLLDGRVLDGFHCHAAWFETPAARAPHHEGCGGWDVDRNSGGDGDGVGEGVASSWRRWRSPTGPRPIAREAAGSPRAFPEAPRGPGGAFIVLRSAGWCADRAVPAVPGVNGDVGGEAGRPWPPSIRARRGEAVCRGVTPGRGFHGSGSVCTDPVSTASASARPTDGRAPRRRPAPLARMGAASADAERGHLDMRLFACQ